MTEERTIYASETIKVAGVPVLVDLWSGDIVGTLNDLYRFKEDNGRSIDELVKREFNAKFKR